MKKYIFSIISSIFIILFASISINAAEIQLYSPSVNETEIMPTRDFYVIGSINREGESAKSMPLDIKIELLDSQGVVIRSLKSNVAPDGVTSAEYFMNDYDQGYSQEDDKGVNISQFTPPDIIYDGTDRDSIRQAHTKIVVKENYFAAAIYSGATKEFDLIFTDEHEFAYQDITEGEYTLVVTALDKNNEEICRYQQILKFGNTQGRIISSDTKTIEEYAIKNDLTVSDSFVGKWVPVNYLNAPKHFSYTIDNRYLTNLAVEYGNSKNISILLHNLNPNNIDLNFKLGSAFEAESDKSYLYYDIGESKIDFQFAGASLNKDGTIVKHDKDRFVEILRAETANDDDSYVDFNSSDGFVLTKDKTTTFYGVFSPMISSSILSGASYKIVDDVTNVKIIISDENNRTLYEELCNPYLKRDNQEDTSRYEFAFSITPTLELLKSDKNYLTVILCNAKNEEILIGEKISLKINNGGNFIGGYSDTYWGKSFCDTINFFGQNPAGEALNPDEFIKRGDFAAMINRLLGYSITQKSKFADLNEENIYYTDCVTAQAVGYMTGDEKGMVNAEDYISREQAMIILARISGAEEGDIPVKFADANEISFWAEKYVNIMCSNGIVTGFDGYLNPTDSITVAEASALIIKTIKWMYNSEDTFENNIIETDSTDLSGIEISDTDFLSEINFDTISAFFESNSDVFSSIATYIRNNCHNGAYIGKIGNGLEIRDYSMGNFIVLSDDAINIITKLSAQFAEFSIKYNPVSENAIHFTLGRNTDNKTLGLTYTTLDGVKNKKLTEIDENWYYYIQE